MSSRIIVKGWFKIPRHLLTQAQIEEAIRSLTIRYPIRDFITNEEKPPRLIYALDNEYFFVPPHYGFTTYTDLLTRHGYDDLRCVGGKRPALAKFEGTLDEAMRKQVSGHAAIMASITQVHGGALLALPPGDGKTVLALKIISDIGLRTLIVVHKKFLDNQWQERMSIHLPNALVAEMHADVMPDPKADIVIATIQSIFHNKYLWLDPNGNSLNFSEEEKLQYLQRGDVPAGSILTTFGFTIIDEAQYYSSNKFSRVLWQVRPLQRTR